MTHDELLKKIKAQEEYWTNLVHYTKPEFYENTVDQRNAWQALKAVVELHKPFFGLCQVCKQEGDEDTFDYIGVSYPCPTIQAIDKALS